MTALLDKTLRFDETIDGRAYHIEVMPVSNRWRAQLCRTPGLPTAMMPFYGATPDEAAHLLAVPDHQERNTWQLTHTHRLGSLRRIRRSRSTGLGLPVRATPRQHEALGEGAGLENAHRGIRVRGAARRSARARVSSMLSSIEQ